MGDVTKARADLQTVQTRRLLPDPSGEPPEPAGLLGLLGPAAAAATGNSGVEIAGGGDGEA
eukprot:9371641-Pyramimonas_sp.AAC.1